MKFRLGKIVKVTVLCAALASSSLVMATTNEHTSAIETLQNKLTGLKSFRAHFNQTVTDGQGEVIQTSQGELLLKQPAMMRWQVSSPDESTLIADGTTLWHIDPFVEQVTAMDQQQSVANNPIILLTDTSAENWDKFTVEQYENGYTVVAKDPQSQILSLRLVFDQDELTSLTFVDRQQQVSQLTFDQIHQNLDIGERLFQFTLPEGYDLDDQR